MKIGLVISGGDGVGINNFIFQIAKLSGAKIVLYNNGINGLIDNYFQEIDYKELLDFSTSSTPIIMSGRKSRLPDESDYETIKQNLHQRKVDILIMAGGDGSLRFLDKLSRYGVNCFGVAMTIDNDIMGSEYSIGFSTACEQIRKEVTKLRNTGRALPGRLFLVESLGAYCGELTLQAAIKSNADIALIPEHHIPINELADRIKRKFLVQNSVVILCSESYTNEYYPGFQGAINTIATELEPLIGIRVRKAILGFSLRSGEPTTEEIYKGTIIANEMVRCIKSGMKNKAIIINKSNKPIPINLLGITNRTVDKEGHYYKLARDLNII